MKLQMMNRLAFACVLAVSALGCRSNSSASPGPIYLSTRPPGARVLIDNVEFFTPCSLPKWVFVDQTIEISKAGYQSYRGPLIDLVQSGANSYTMDLVASK